MHFSLAKIIGLTAAISAVVGSPTPELSKRDEIIFTLYSDYGCTGDIYEYEVSSPVGSCQRSGRAKSGFVDYVDSCAAIFFSDTTCSTVVSAFDGNTPAGGCYDFQEDVYSWGIGC
jgi:hypothetical protein